MLMLVSNKTFPVASRWRYDYNGIWLLDMFRPGLLSNLISLGKIVHFMAELQQLLFPCETSNLSGRHGHALLTKTQDLNNLTLQRPLD